MVTGGKVLFSGICFSVLVACLSACGGGGGGNSGGGGSSSSSSSSQSSERPVVSYNMGNRLLVNTQIMGFQLHPSVTSLTNGNVVVAWTDSGVTLIPVSQTIGDADGSSINIRIYNAEGIAQTGEILVNTETAGFQQFPKVAALTNGRFVVVWEDPSQTLSDTSGASIKAQIFNADGTKNGSEYLVNSQTNGDQTLPKIAPLSSGGFVVTWTSVTDGQTFTQAQIFNADGAKLGTEFRIHAHSENELFIYDIDTLSNGQIIIVFTNGSSQYHDATIIYAQKYSATGNTIGAPIQLHQGAVTDPVVSGLTNGNFAIAWTAHTGTLGVAPNFGIFTQLFDASGTALNTPQAANTQEVAVIPAITGLKNGDFSVAWIYQWGVSGQIFRSDGSKFGAEYLLSPINDRSSAVQLAAMPSGGFATTWMSSDTDSWASGVDMIIHTPQY